MILTLEVTGPEAGKLGAASRKVFKAAGGSIGRSAENSLVLQDPYVSARHALVRYNGGTFYIEDTSTNGVFINSLDNRLGRGEQYALKSGDRIIIDPYEIRATITGGAEESEPSPLRDLFEPAPRPAPAAAPLDPFSQDPFGVSPEPPARSAAPHFSGADAELDSGPLPMGEVDPLNLLGGSPQRAPARGAPRAADLDAGSLMSEHYEAPRPLAPAHASAPASGGVIPEGYDPLGPDSQILSAPAAPPVRPASEPARPSPRAARPAGARPGQARPDADPHASGGTRGDGSLADVLAGAGLRNVEVTPELARSFGEILRVVVSGLMDVLQARHQIKDEFRIRVTTFKRADNNPLKFSANVEDALHNLLVKRNDAYLEPIEAFEDAFDDVRNHQMAMLAGVRAAFEAMLADFNPDALQDEFDRQLKKGGPQLVPAKMRYWDLYRDKVRDMVKDPEAGFRELFGDEFATAYEEQLERLKAQHRPGKR